MAHKKKTNKTSNAMAYRLAYALAVGFLCIFGYRYLNTHRFFMLQTTSYPPVLTLHASSTTPTTDGKHYWIRTACTDTPQQANHLCTTWKTASVACRVDTQQPLNTPCAQVVLGPFRTMDQARFGEKWLALHHLRGHLE